MENNYFDALYAVDVSEKTKIKPGKNQLTYLPWSSAWAEVKRRHPDAEYEIDVDDNNRFWFDDGRSGWVHVYVTIEGITHDEYFPVMDHRNDPIPADEIRSTHANKAVKRALTKCCADHGLALYLYEGEELKEDGTRKTKEDKEIETAKKALSALCKEKIAAGIDRNRIYQIIESENNGNRNPKSIASVEVCHSLIEKIKTVK